MVETPLFGRYQGEDRRLLFAAPPAYLLFIRAVGLVGLGYGLRAFGFPIPLPGPEDAGWSLLVAAMVLGAAFLADASLDFIAFDLREGTFRRRTGPGLARRTWGGRISDLEALVLVAEIPALRPNIVSYHLVLHWRGRAMPPMILQSDHRAKPMGVPLDAPAAQIRNQGIRYARTLGVPLYDNAHFVSPHPLGVR